MNVLIADDNVIVRNGLEKMIPWEELNSKVVATAADGKEVLELMKTHSVDLVISDIRMPNMDGLELCKNINETYTDTYIILISAYEDFQYARTAMSLGVKHYILKPFDREKVQMLKDIVQEMNSELLYKKKLYEDLYNGTIEDKVLTALKQKDEGFFVSFFEEVLCDFERFGIDIMGLCIKLIDIMYSYFKEVGINPESLIDSRERHISKLLLIKEKTEMLNYILEIYNNVLHFSKSNKKEQSNNFVVNSVVEYINNNYSNCFLSLTDMAEHMKISPAYLSVIFRQNVGQTITSYMAELRIKQAKIYLEDQQAKIQDIVKKIGYQDQRYFSSVFKKMTGVTPSEYRQLIQLRNS